MATDSKNKVLQDTDGVLNIPLRKAHALEILRGEKVREYRTFSDHWAKRLCTFEDPQDPYLATGIKQFKRVHFYPYNNKWFVDCEVKAIIWYTVDEEFLKEFGHEVEAEIDSQIFIIRLGEIIDTNLAV